MLALRDTMARMLTVDLRNAGWKDDVHINLNGIISGIILNKDAFPSELELHSIPEALCVPVRKLFFVSLGGHRIIMVRVADGTLNTITTLVLEHQVRPQTHCHY